MTTTTLAREPYARRHPHRAWGKADPHTLGGRIQLARVQNGMTQTELATAIGSTRVAIASIEFGKNGVSFSRVMAIAKALDVSLDYIAGLSAEFGVFPEQEGESC